MNLSTLSTALNVGKAAWEKFADYRDEKAREAYTALEGAAKNVDNATQDWFPESRKQAGFVTQAAHSRLEGALGDLDARRQEVAATIAEKTEELSADTKKSTKKARKNAAKSAKKARKNAEKKFAKATGKKKKGGFGKFFLFALVSAIAGAIFYVLRGKETPSTKPPRVEEHSGDAEKAAGSTLVYSSTTDADKADKADKPESDLVEEGVTERDEELLGSIDQQLAEMDAESPTNAAEFDEANEPVDVADIQSDEYDPAPAGGPADVTTPQSDERDEEAVEAAAETGAAADINTSRLTDDRKDEGKHRLASDGPTPNAMPETIAETVEADDDKE